VDPSELESVTREPLPSEARIAARVRAALAYSGLRYDELAARTPQLGEATLRRITSPTAPRGADVVELWKIADGCGVPRSWLLYGEWDDSGAMPLRLPRFGAGKVEDRLAVIENYLTALLILEEARHGHELPLPPPEPGPRPPSPTPERLLRQAIAQARPESPNPDTDDEQESSARAPRARP
jgi:hypothetical protein